MIAWSLPPTYVFEGMRALLMEHVFRADLMIEAFVLNVLYFAAACLPSCNCSRARGASARCCRPANRPVGRWLICVEVPSGLIIPALLRRKRNNARQIII